MDFSETYISMCEKALEIQNSWQYMFGDYYYDKSGSYLSSTGRSEGGVNIVDENVLNDIMEGSFVRKTAIWLPRQDQIQERLQDIVGNFKELYNLIKNTENKLEDNFSSFEQLWLAIYINKRYSKMWNGENWIEG